MTLTANTPIYDTRTGREGVVIDATDALVHYRLHSGVTAYARPANLIVRTRPCGNGRLPLNAND